MNWFINNRELIKNLAINTGTTLNPTYTKICTTSEVQVATDLETKDFYVFCDNSSVVFSLLDLICLELNTLSVNSSSTSWKSLK